MTHSLQNTILVFTLCFSLAFGQMVCLCTSSAAASEHMATAIATAGPTDAHNHHTHLHSEHTHHIAGEENQGHPCDSGCDHCDIEAVQQNDNQPAGRTLSHQQETIALAPKAAPAWTPRHSGLQSRSTIRGRAPPPAETLFSLGVLHLV